MTTPVRRLSIHNETRPTLTAEEVAAMRPMDAVRAFRDNRRESKALKARESDLTAEKQALDAVIQAHMAAGDIPVSMPVDGGGNVHIKHEVWVSVPDDQLERFLAVAAKYDGTDYSVSHLITGKPNTRSLTSFISDYLDDDKTKEAVDRLKGNLPDDLVACLKVTDKHYINANGL